MNETTVGVRLLKSRLSEYLRKVKSGQTVVITEHGKPVGRLVPASQSLDERMAAMVDAGLIVWSGHKLKPTTARVRVRGKRTVADLLIEDRE